MFKGFRELECYKEARFLRMFVSQLTKKFPEREKFLLTAQILDSSRSSTSNIAEGYGRYNYNDTKRFFTISRGSTSETMEHLITALDEHYISEQEFSIGEQKCELVFKLTSGYIEYLRKKGAL